MKRKRDTIHRLPCEARCGRMHLFFSVSLPLDSPSSPGNISPTLLSLSPSHCAFPPRPLLLLVITSHFICLICVTLKRTCKQDLQATLLLRGPHSPLSSLPSQRLKCGVEDYFSSLPYLSTMSGGTRHYFKLSLAKYDSTCQWFLVYLQMSHLFTVCRVHHVSCLSRRHFFHQCTRYFSHSLRLLCESAFHGEEKWMIILGTGTRVWVKFAREFMCTCGECLKGKNASIKRTRTVFATVGDTWVDGWRLVRQSVMRCKRREREGERKSESRSQWDAGLCVARSIDVLLVFFSPPKNVEPFLRALRSREEAERLLFSIRMYFLADSEMRRPLVACTLERCSYEREQHREKERKRERRKSGQERKKVVK